MDNSKRSSESHSKVNGTKSLECPFTWKLNEKLVDNFHETEEPVIEVNEQPAMALVNSTMITYIRTVQRDWNGALKNVEKTAEMWNQIDKRQLKEESISSDVLFHVMKATEFYLNNILKPSYELLDEITDPTIFQSKMELSTINGCKSIAWSCFHEHGCKEATLHAELAILDSPNCPLWHFILGKNQRHERRYGNYSFDPSLKEMDSFKKSYSLSKRPFYAVHVAQMYREKNDHVKSKEIYEAVYAANPASLGIKLRLARAFIAFKQFSKAKSCLDYVEKYRPDESMFLHYKGTYFEKLKDYKMAAEYLRKAGDKGNYKADLQYASCMKNIDRKFDFINHLQKMLAAYKHKPVKQQINLHIAMQYFYTRKDIENALLYFLRAIELNPEGEQLEKFFNTTVDWKQVNVFDFIYNKLLPEFRYNESNSSINTQNMIEKLKNYCEKQILRKDPLSNSFNKMRL